LPAQANANLEKLVADLGNETQHQVRQDAYQALFREKPAAAIPLLLEALPRYQTNSLTLGVSLLQGYPPDLGQPALRKLLRREAPLLELCAAVALLRTGDQGVVDHVVQPLSRPDIAPATRSTMLNQLWGIKDPRVLAAVPGAGRTRGADGRARQRALPPAADRRTARPGRGPWRSRARRR
jgi:hypothetical protein